MLGAQVSSAMLFDAVAAGEEFTICNTLWRHSSDSARQRSFTMVFRLGPVSARSAAHLLHLHNTNNFVVKKLSESLLSRGLLRLARACADPASLQACGKDEQQRTAARHGCRSSWERATDASLLCYFVAIHDVLVRSVTSTSSSAATTMGPAPATPFTGLELGPLLGKARAWGLPAPGCWPV